jgi:cell pole-organizing protein PopZ
MSDAKKDVPEPSMEEILSSIRRIIAEEDDHVPNRPAEDPGRKDLAGEDVLELTDRIDDGRPLAPVATIPVESRPRPIEPVAAARPAAPKPSSPANRPAAPAPVQADQPAIEPSPLVSGSAAAASAAALSKLARVAAPAPNDVSRPISGLTVEQLLVSMLEPMLKEWFDKNLPAVVERIVEEEVKKLVRRAELQ